MLRWGILSTGEIASAFAEACPQTRHGGTLAAVGSRTAEAAEAFGAAHGIRRCHGSYEALLADPEVDAIYVATIHPAHAEWTIRAAQAGKHVLCEKPLAMTAAEAAAMAAAAEAADVALLEAFAYRHSPQARALMELVESGAIGEPRLIEAAFSFAAPHDPTGRLLDPALGGGGILDVGCYAVDVARRIAGEDPVEVVGVARIGATGVDEVACALLRFADGLLAQLTCGVALDHPSTVRVLGTEGVANAPAPWDGSDPSARVQLARRGEKLREVPAPGTASVQALTADALAALVADPGGRARERAHAVGNMRVLDRWRAAIGLRYPGEPA